MTPLTLHSGDWGYTAKAGLVGPLHKFPSVDRFAISDTLGVWNPDGTTWSAYAANVYGPIIAIAVPLSPDMPQGSVWRYVGNEDGGPNMRGRTLHIPGSPDADWNKWSFKPGHRPLFIPDTEGDDKDRWGNADFTKSQPATAPATTPVEPTQVDCPCTMFEQDESCPVGFPSMVCGICGGIGHTTPEKVTALAVEMLRIASDLGEPEDPFAAWEQASPLADKDAEIARLTAELAEMKSERSFIVGANHGWDEAVSQGAGGPIAARLRDALTAAQGRVERLEGALQTMASWTEAALNCAAWQWDADQREVAERDLAEARALSTTAATEEGT